MRRFAGLLLAASLLLPAAAGAETVLHRGNGAEPETLDPHMTTGLPEAMIFYDLYEGLVARDARGQAQPGLAERWTVSEDGLTVTFHLRSGGKWSDGSPVTAQDVVFSFRRLVDPANGGRNSNYLWPLVNAKEITEGKVKDLAQLGVRAVDARTVEFRLKEPTPYFVPLLSYPMLVPLKEANVTALGRDFAKPGKLVSSGAYMLAEAVLQGHVKLVRNPHYRDAAKVRIDAVYFHPTENQETELKRYRSGELHATYTLPPTQIPWARANLAGDLRVGPRLGTYYYAPNFTREPWKSNRNLRLALSMALDREVIAEKIAQGGEVASYSYVPPGVTGYTPQLPDWAAWPKEKRLAEAKRLLAAAGYPEGKGLTVDLLFNTAENHRKVAIAMASMWKQGLGVDTILTNQEWKVFLETRRAKTFRDLSRNGYVGAYDDPNVFLEFLRSDVGPENPSGYADPAYDELLRRAALERDPDRRRALLAEAERKVLAEQAVIPVYTYATARLVNPRVKGWVDNPLDVHPTRFLSIE
ncbi:MAG TPA: peptide ABC transporter substrate-binding protein [Azospirillaceae bacterium]|nr:peptide ABC transporter substrate-binding protein [Azospirillaceae bacterium]